MTDEPTSLGGPELYEALGRAIRAIRAELGMDRRELAELSGVSYPYLSEIENGKKRPSSRALVALAEALGMAPSELLQRAESLTPSIPTHGRISGKSLGTAIAAPPASSAKQRMAEGQWFESRLEAETPVVAARMGSTASASHRQSALSELFAVAASLREEDLWRLLDLARRLGEGGAAR